jgi:hypothetical protein
MISKERRQSSRKLKVNKGPSLKRFVSIAAICDG